MGIAAAAPDAQRHDVDIPALNAADALNRLARQTGATFLFPYDLAKDRHANRVHGRYSLMEALGELLEGSGLSAGLSKEGVITIAVSPEAGSKPEGKSAMSTGHAAGGKEPNGQQRGLLAFVAGIAGALFSGGGAAEPADPDGRFDGRVIEEVLVTAQRRDQSLQDVPISVSTLSADQLRAANISSTEDLENVVPSLIFGESGRDGQVFIRGVGSTRLSLAGADPSSSLYIDGVYQSRFGGYITDLLDVERIEVLRGPQGTLYGRNSTGGAIKIVTADPAEELGAEVRATYGNHDHWRLVGRVDMPIVEDRVLLRAVAMHSEREGYVTNIGPPPDSFDRQDLDAGRVTLKIVPSDSLDLTFHAGGSRDDSDQTFLKHYVDPDGLFGAAEVVPDPWTARTDFGPREAPVESWYVDGTVEWSVGPAVITSITAYNSIDVGPYNGDVDATEVPGLQDGIAGRKSGIADGGDSFTQEVSFTFAGGDRWEGVAGLFYLSDDNYTHNQGLFIPIIPALADNYTLTDADVDVEAYAGFVDGSVYLTDQLRLNAGIRYSDEKKEIVRSQKVNFVLSRGPEALEKSWDAWTPRVGIDWFVSDDAMLYAAYSKGFKSGAFAAGSFDPAVNPEYVDSYEIGAKTQWFDRRLTVNAAVFTYDYTDMQVQGIDPTAVPPVEIIRNAAAADIDGMEIEGTWMPVDGLTINFGASWLDAAYTDFPTLAGNLQGNTLPNAPEWTTNLGIEYAVAIADAGELVLNASMFASDENFLTEANDPVRGRMDDYQLFNARATFAPYNAPWEVSVYGKNLSDELVYSRTVISDGLFGANGFLAYLEPPRTFGLELSVRL